MTDPRTWALALLWICFSACQTPPSSADEPADAHPLAYRCEVPVGLEREITLLYKSGASEAANAHVIFRKYHRIGWLGQIRACQETGYVRFPERTILIAEFGIMTTSRRIGRAEAIAAMHRYRLAHDDEALMAALRKLYPQRAD